MANPAPSRPEWMVALDNAEPDDEELGPETQASIEEALAELRAGAPTLTTEELLEQLGLKP
jgi:hypothetical protein